MDVPCHWWNQTHKVGQTWWSLVIHIIVLFYQPQPYPHTDGGVFRDFYHDWTNSILQHLKTRNFSKIADALFRISTMTNSFKYSHQVWVPPLQFSTGPSNFQKMWARRPSVLQFSWSAPTHTSRSFFFFHQLTKEGRILRTKNLIVYTGVVCVSAHSWANLQSRDGGQGRRGNNNAAGKGLCQRLCQEHARWLPQARSHRTLQREAGGAHQVACALAARQQSESASGINHNHWTTSANAFTCACTLPFVWFISFIHVSW